MTYANDVNAIARCTVRLSRNYNMFKFKDGNRDLNYINVNKMEESLKKHGWVTPIVVDNNYYIIDGQHRFQAAKNLGMPIAFIKMSNDFNVEAIRDINNAQEKWNTWDYVKSQADLGNVHFQHIQSLRERFAEGGVKVIEAAINEVTGYKKYLKYYALHPESFRFNEYDYDVVCNALDYTYKIIKTIDEVKATRTLIGPKRYIARAVLFMLTHGVNEKELLKKVEKYGSKFRYPGGMVDALENLDEIYNTHRRGEVVSFTSMYLAENGTQRKKKHA